MDDRHRKVLQKCWIELRRDLEPKKLFPYLTEVLDDSDIEDLNAISLRKDCVDVLLEKLPRKGPQAFGIFVKALQEKQAHLATTLQDAEVGMMSEELKRERASSAKRRNEADEAKAALRHEKKEHEVTQKKLKEITSHYEALMTENEKYKKDVNFKPEYLQKISDEMEKEKEEHKLQLDAKEQELVDLKHQLEVLSEELKERNEENEELRKSLESEGSGKKKPDEMEKENEEQMLPLDAKEQEVAGLKYHLDVLSEELEERYKENEELRKSLESGGSGKLTTEFESTWQLQLDAKEQEVADLKYQLDVLSEELEERDKENEELRKSLESEGSGIKDVNLKLKNLQKKSDEMKKEIEEQKLQLDAKKEELAELQELLEKQEPENERVLKELEKLQKENDQLRADVDDENKKLKQKLDEMEKEKEEERSKLDAKEQELAKLQNLLKKQELENERVLEEPEKLQKENDQLRKDSDDENKRLKQPIEEINSKLGDPQEKSDEMRNEKEEQRSQLDAKERELAEFKDQLEKKESENERILKEFENLQKDNDQLRKGFDDKNCKLKRVFHYKGDFDRNGVIYAMGTSFGGTKWENPSSKSDLSTRVTATRSSDKLGSASDLLNYSYKTGKESGTKDDNGSWWCVALSENYSLYLTHYTLRHGLSDGNSFLRHWKLEGSLDGSNWEVLKKHEDDKKLSRPSENFTATWSIDREVGAFRFFRIFQTGENSSGKYGISLSGIELYGALIERSCR